MPEKSDSPRFWLVDLLIYWEGQVNVKSLVEQFEMSRQYASKIFQEYRQKYPDNIYLDSSIKAYRPSEHFQAHFITGDVNEYLEWIHSGVRIGNRTKRSVPSFSLHRPARNVSNAVIRQLVLAMREKERIEVDYISLSNPCFEGRVSL